MSIWKNLFGGGSKPPTIATPNRPQPSASALKPAPPQPSSTGKGYVVLSGTDDNMEPMTRAGSILVTLQYDGGPSRAILRAYVEGFDQ